LGIGKSFSNGSTTERIKRPKLDFYIGGKIFLGLYKKSILAVQEKIKIGGKKL